MNAPRGLLVAAVPVAALVLAAVGPVSADPGAASADPVIGLSVDGEEFADAIDVPLIDPAVVWVPGDRRTSELHVRNQAGDDADVSVEVRGARTTPGWLGVEASVGDGWQPVGVAGTGPLGAALVPGEERRVALRLTMAADAPQRAMRVSTGLRFRVRLTEAAAGTARPPGGGLLPDTGAGPGPGLLLLCLAMLAGGVRALRVRSAS